MSTHRTPKSYVSTDGAVNVWPVTHKTSGKNLVVTGWTWAAPGEVLTFPSLSDARDETAARGHGTLAVKAAVR